jgi:hypothetical protein
MWIIFSGDMKKFQRNSIEKRRRIGPNVEIPAVPHPSNASMSGFSQGMVFALTA